MPLSRPFGQSFGHVLVEAAPFPVAAVANIGKVSGATAPKKEREVLAWWNFDQDSVQIIDSLSYKWSLMKQLAKDLEIKKEDIASERLRLMLFPS